MKKNDYLAHFSKSNGFTYPDWGKIEDIIPNNLSDNEQDDLWNQIIHHWSEYLVDDLGSDYQIFDSPNFKIISSCSSDFINKYSSFLERSLSSILSRLPHIAYKYENEPLLVIIIENHDDYYRYISHFYDDGEFGLNGGLFYKKGLGHFVFPHLDHFSSEQVSAHELTHALLNHFNLPVWLDEGIATNMEDYLTLSNPLNSTQEIRTKHAKFWNEERMQQFWSGESFSRTDEGQELSYHLAQLLVQQLAKSYNAFANFCNLANHNDAGEQALQETFDLSLHDLIVPLLGDKNWGPQPSSWQNQGNNLIIK